MGVEQEVFLCTDNGSKYLQATVIINGMACIQQESPLLRPNMGIQLCELLKANEESFTANV